MDGSRLGFRFIAACILAVMLIGMWFKFRLSANKDKVICSSEECIRVSKYYKQSMDINVNPCENFYKYACGQWNLEKQNKSKISWMQDQINKDIEIFLKSNYSADEIEPLRQSKIFYKSCINQRSNIKPSKQLLQRHLEHLHLPLIPTFFKNNGKNSSDFNWMMQEIILKKVMNINAFFDINTVTSKNTTVYINLQSKSTKFIIRKILDFFLHRSTPSMNSTLNFTEFIGDKEASKFKNVNKYAYGAGNIAEIKETLEMFEFTTTTPVLREAAETINKIERKMDLIINKYTPLKNISYSRTGFQLLVNMVNRSNHWRQFSTSLHDLLGSNNNTKIWINFDFAQLNAFFNYVIGCLPQQLELYIWRIVILEIQDSYQTIRNSLDLQKNESINCVNNVQMLMGEAVSFGISKIYSNELINNEVKTMVNNIKRVYEYALQFLTPFTKNYILENSQKSLIRIGNLNNKTSLEKYFDNVHLSEHDYVGNLYDLKIMLFGGNLEKLSTANAINPSRVNAFFIKSENSINIPNSIMSPPIFNYFGLDAPNYGSLGFIIGHEIYHGFDIPNLLSDGNRIKLYNINNMLDCFSNQYNGYHGIMDNNNTFATLLEDLADTGGLRLSYLAYKQYAENNEEYDALTGFENYSKDQLFFIAFANTWCGLEQIPEENSPSHSSNPYRVIASLQNNQYFAQSFNCPLGSNMNPMRERCSILYE